MFPTQPNPHNNHSIQRSNEQTSTIAVFKRGIMYIRISKKKMKNISKSLGHTSILGASKMHPS
jgi:hypothetical protein